ncbi:hypothetical protein [Phytoactinopolyspora limicola]|uniref:hypothetical protein n=1 Tax=Phytoactinopolyspora limicola TaxID=2715536 RepID=UPI0014072FA9|nr:hypothetical protein [Phytoactinopolyspora limicola]
MSTLAFWLFVAVAVLFVIAVLVVVLAIRSTARKGKVLSQEVGALSQELDHVVGSQGRQGPP